MSEPFLFWSESYLVLHTSWQADSLRSLLDCVRQVSGSSIFYHFFHALRRRHYTTFGYKNDFADWVDRNFHEPNLAERLAVIDPLEFQSVRATREALVRELEGTAGLGDAQLHVRPGEEFRFVTVKSFVQATGQSASTPIELADGIERASLGSFFFHFIEARLRTGRLANDYSIWLEQEYQASELAARVAKLSPYLYPLPDLRSRVATLIRENCDR